MKTTGQKKTKPAKTPEFELRAERALKRAAKIVKDKAVLSTFLS